MRQRRFLSLHHHHQAGHTRLGHCIVVVAVTGDVDCLCNFGATMRGTFAACGKSQQEFFI